MTLLNDYVVLGSLGKGAYGAARLPPCFALRGCRGGRRIVCSSGCLVPAVAHLVPAACAAERHQFNSHRLW